MYHCSMPLSLAGSTKGYVWLCIASFLPSTSFAVGRPDDILTPDPSTAPTTALTLKAYEFLFLFLILRNTQFCEPLWSLLTHFTGFLEDPFKPAIQEHFLFVMETVLKVPLISHKLTLCSLFLSYYLSDAKTIGPTSSRTALMSAAVVKCLKSNFR